LDRKPEHGDRGGGGLGIDRPDLVAPELGGGCRRALVRPGKRRRDVQRVDAVVLRQLLVRLEKVAGRGLRRRRQLLGSAQPRVELLRRELDVVAVALVAEEHVQRHHPPARKTLSCLRKVGSRVEHDRRILGGQLHYAARRIASTISSSSWSFDKQATAPAS